MRGEVPQKKAIVLPEIYYCVLFWYKFFFQEQLYLLQYQNINIVHHLILVRPLVYRQDHESFGARFLSLRTIGIPHVGLSNSWLWGAALYIVGCFEASPAFTLPLRYQYRLPRHDNQKWPQTLASQRWGTKITASEKPLL